MSEHRQEDPIRTTNNFTCLACNPPVEMDRYAIVKHLRDKHGVDTRRVLCRKRLIGEHAGEGWKAAATEIEFPLKGQAKRLKLIQVRTEATRRRTGPKDQDPFPQDPSYSQDTPETPSTKNPTGKTK